MSTQSKNINHLNDRLKIFIGKWNVEISGMSFRADKAETVTGLITI